MAGDTRIEGGAVVCRHCNRVLTFNFIDRPVSEPCPCRVVAAGVVKSAPAAAIESLRDECYVMSIDGCCHCGDCECDGIGCITNLDPDDEDDHPAIERLHSTLRQGQAWAAMHELMVNGATLGTAYLVASDALINADNHMVDDQTRAWFRDALSDADERALVDTLWPESTPEADG